MLLKRIFLLLIVIWLPGLLTKRDLRHRALAIIDIVVTTVLLLITRPAKQTSAHKSEATKRQHARACMCVAGHRLSHVTKPQLGGWRRLRDSIDLSHILHGVCLACRAWYRVTGPLLVLLLIIILLLVPEYLSRTHHLFLLLSVLVRWIS
jgi:hypothetical protein